MNVNNKLLLNNDEIIILDLVDRVMFSSHSSEFQHSTNSYPGFMFGIFGGQLLVVKQYENTHFAKSLKTVPYE